MQALTPLVLLPCSPTVVPGCARSLIAGEHKFVFQVQSNLLLVMVSSTGESTSQMRMQLNYVYNQILFVLTLSQLSRVFQQQNFDLRRMLGGTEKFIDNLLDMFDTNPSFFLGAVCTLCLADAMSRSVPACLGGMLAAGVRAWPLYTLPC